MNVSILVPYGPAGAERERAWAWNEQRWRRLLPEAELVVASPDHVGVPGEFNRPLAINRAAEIATGDVFVIADSDTAVAEEPLFEATWLVWKQNVPWVLPQRYVRLDEATSDAWLRQEPESEPPASWPDGVAEEWPANVSGNVVVTRENFEAVGGFDERFKGWGWDDGAFACAVSTLCGDPLRLVGHFAWHLWHPRPPEDSVWGPYAARQQQLGGRYVEASGNEDAMRALLAERP